MLGHQHRDAVSPVGILVVGAALLLIGCSKRTPSAPTATPTGPTTPTTPKAPPPGHVGSVAPAGAVTASDGTTVELAGLWAKQPAVIVFYRGHW